MNEWGQVSVVVSYLNQGIPSSILEWIMTMLGDTSLIAEMLYGDIRDIA